MIQGLECAERNILPILNNLLENREMALEDGSFLMNPQRYDALLSEGYTDEQLQLKSIFRVHPDFMVIGLCSPTPRYHGTPLDPPLRSRFQAFFLPPIVATEKLHICSSHLTKEAFNIIEPIIRFEAAVNSLIQGISIPISNVTYS